ncbi:hypothetical protein D6745_04580 [Candidatus Woesearchaeota archaeon]|nr:MAG: hypothetical protein D6745_04580 [Candidatus Woesearchaeota archaeon]
MVLYNLIGETGQSIANPLIVLWNGLVDFIPGFIAAIIVMVLGYYVASSIDWLIRKGLSKIKFDDWVKHMKITDSVGGMTLSTLVGKIVKWYVFIVFLIPAVELIHLGRLSDLLAGFVEWLPSLIIGVVIGIFGLIIADYADNKIKHIKRRGMPTLSLVVRVIIYVFIADLALQQMGLRLMFAEQIILVVVAGLVLALSLALGIGLGSALKDESKAWLKKVKNKW